LLFLLFSETFNLYLFFAKIIMKIL